MLRGITGLGIGLTLAGMGCGASQQEPVRATLDGDQVLVGELDGGVLVLQGGLGELHVPLSQVGEVDPVEGGDLGHAHGNVRVWLKNGTELVGKWAEPELGVSVTVGGKKVNVDVPTDSLQRFQMQGQTVFPSGLVYRLKTPYGDDVFVDPKKTQLRIDSSLGRFEPYLSECVSARPLGAPEGDWRLELVTGTVLVGKLVDSEIPVALDMGPASIVVPVASLNSLSRENWNYEQSYLDYQVAASRGPAATTPATGDGSGGGAQAGEEAAVDWFSSAPMYNLKQEAH